MAPLREGEASDHGQRITETLEAAELAAQNPRALKVDDRTLQRRNNIATELLSFYEFLAGLYLPIEALKYPPEDGWEYINAERFAYLGKTDAVIDLYKHIPYIAQDDEYEYLVTPGCICMDYTGRHFRSERLGMLRDVDPDVNVVTDEQPWRLTDQAQHIAILAVPTKANDGTYIAIDTRDGTTADIGLCRGEDDQVCKYGSISGLLGEWKHKFRTLAYIPLSPTDVVPATHSKVRAIHGLKEIYHKYGWPEGFQQEEGLSAANRALDVRNQKNDWLYRTA